MPADKVAAQLRVHVMLTPFLRLWPQMVAVLTGGLLAFMVMFNGRLAVEGTPLFASLAAHGTGTVAGLFLLSLLALRPRRSGAAAPGRTTQAPLWAYLGGVSGAATVMLSSFTVNSPLALSGTLALGLGGQVVFGLLADSFGLFGLPRRQPGLRDLAALGLVAAGSLVLIYTGQGAVE